MGIHGVLTGFVLFITTRAVGNSFSIVAICEKLNQISIFMLIYLILNKLAWMFVSVCHENYMLIKQGFAILQQFAHALWPELFSFQRMTADTHSVM